MIKRFQCALVLACWLVVSCGARADNLDAALLKQAPKVMQYLKDKQYQNVGVVKFRVQKGKEPLTFRAGPLNSNLASRLENALVLMNDKEKPVGIIHDADKVAHDRRLSSYSSDAGMGKLFEQHFPLAWGDRTVRADAFLTGTVRVPADMKTANVTIQAFAPNASALETVATFTVDVDRALLNDLGQSFSLNARSLTKKTRALDLEASDDAATRDQTPGSASTQTSEKLLDFEIRYNGQRQTYAADPQNGGEMVVAEPQEGQKVTFLLKSTAKDTIAVALMINGKNSLYEQEVEPVACKKWILDPGVEVEIKGFQFDAATMKPFRVLSPAESESMAYSDNLGLISVFVFRSMKDKPPEPDDSKNIAKGDDSEPTGSGSFKNFGRNISLRNPAPTPITQKTRSLKDRQELLAKQVPGFFGKRGLLGSEATREQSQVEVVAFPNPEQQQALVIRYYKPKGR